MTFKRSISLVVLLGTFMFLALPVFAGEADIKLPPLDKVQFSAFGGMSGLYIMYFGLFVCIVGLLFSVVQYKQTGNMPAHKSMLDVSNIIWETCKSYLAQQGKFLIMLWVLIAICMVYYFMGLSHTPFGEMAIILFCSILGILGSYGVAWFGMRINTKANARTAFASLTGKPVDVVNIPTKSGMSVGLLLVSVELFFMICILIMPEGYRLAPVSSVLPSVSLWAQALSGSQAVSSQKSPISVPTL